MPKKYNYGDVIGQGEFAIVWAANYARELREQEGRLKDAWEKVVGKDRGKRGMENGREMSDVFTELGCGSNPYRVFDMLNSDRTGGGELVTFEDLVEWFLQQQIDSCNLKEELGEHVVEKYAVKELKEGTSLSEFKTEIEALKVIKGIPGVVNMIEYAYPDPDLDSTLEIWFGEKYTDAGEWVPKNVPKRELMSSESNVDPDEGAVECSFSKESNGYLVMEQIEGVELHKDQSIFYIEGEIQRIMGKLVQIISGIHTVGAHCDLKAQNIMYNQKEGVCTVIDFGFFTQRGELEGWRGNIAHFSPALMRNFVLRRIAIFIGSSDYQCGTYGTKEADMYALGCIAYKLFKDKIIAKADPEAVITADQSIPFRAKLVEINEFLTSLRKKSLVHWSLDEKQKMGTYSQITNFGDLEETEDIDFSGIPEMAIDFIKQLLNPEDSRRLTARGALQHPWIMEVTPEAVLASTEPSGSVERLKEAWGDTTEIISDSENLLGVLIELKIHDVNEDELFHKLAKEEQVHYDDMVPWFIEWEKEKLKKIGGDVDDAAEPEPAEPAAETAEPAAETAAPAATTKPSQITRQDAVDRVKVAWESSLGDTDTTIIWTEEQMTDLINKLGCGEVNAQELFAEMVADDFLKSVDYEEMVEWFLKLKGFKTLPGASEVMGDSDDFLDFLEEVDE